jgi:hypothetical protein
MPAGYAYLPVEILEADAVIVLAQTLEFHHLLDSSTRFEAVSLSFTSTLDHFLERGIILDLFRVIIIIKFFFTHCPVALHGLDDSVDSAFLADQEIKNID